MFDYACRKFTLFLYCQICKGVFCTDKLNGLARKAEEMQNYKTTHHHSLILRANQFCLQRHPMLHTFLWASIALFLLLCRLLHAKSITAFRHCSLNWVSSQLSEKQSHLFILYSFEGEISQCLNCQKPSYIFYSYN